MWIHVPSTSLASAPVTAASSLDWTQPWMEELARSVTWKTNSVSLQSLRRVWQTAPSIRLLSGLTSAPSIQNRGVAAYISSLGDFHASHSVLPVNASNRQMKEISGPMSPESSTASNPIESSWKMLQASCGITMNEFGETYERWVTRLRKDSSRRQKQAHHTGESGSLSWPTPTLGGKESRASRAKRGSGGEDLASTATNWPTPQARDYKGFAPKGRAMSTQDARPYLSIPQAPTTTPDGLGSSPDGLNSPQPFAKNHRCSTKCRRLNANFAAHLMGLPRNYLLKSCCGESAMESYRRWQRRLSENLARI